MSEFVVNAEFFLDLQIHLDQTFANSSDPNIATFWCDGIAVPDDAKLWGKTVNSSREVVTQAWIGDDGQTSFKMTILLGPKALSRYARGLDLYPCLPGCETDEWIRVDLERCEVELRLK